MKEILFEGKPYKISFNAMPESLKEKLSKEKLALYLALLEKVQLQPKEVYQQIKNLRDEYPDVPEIINLLTFAHIQNRKILEAEELIEQTFTKYPDYLFARINYADQCVRKKKLEKIPQIFSTFDLKELCPEKEVFHASEFRGFLIMMAYYHLALKDREKALHYYLTAKKVDPHHFSVTYLGKKIFKKSLLQRLLGLVHLRQ